MENQEIDDFVLATVNPEILPSIRSAIGILDANSCFHSRETIISYFYNEEITAGNKGTNIMELIRIDCKNLLYDFGIVLNPYLGLPGIISVFEFIEQIRKADKGLIEFATDFLSIEDSEDKHSFLNDQFKYVNSYTINAFHLAFNDLVKQSLEVMENSDELESPVILGNEQEYDDKAVHTTIS